VRVVNVVDLAMVMSPTEHPNGMDNLYFQDFFTELVPRWPQYS